MKHLTARQREDLKALMKERTPMGRGRGAAVHG